MDLILGKWKKILIPCELYGKVIKGAHDMKAAGHFALNSTMTRLRALFYFPGITAQVQHYLAECEECLHTKRGNNDKKFKYTSTEKGYLNQSCHIDIWGPTPPDSSGYKYVLAMEEVYTRYCIFVPQKKDKCRYCSENNT